MITEQTVNQIFKDCIAEGHKRIYMVKLHNGCWGYSVYDIAFDESSAREKIEKYNKTVESLDDVSFSYDTLILEVIR